MITQQKLKTILEYDPDTGIFTWKWREYLDNHINARWAGREAGCDAFLNGRWYRAICISGEHYLAHRLAWLYVHGYMPEYIDHKDNDGLNNKLLNIREATQSQNMANKAAPCHGVEKHGRKYRARIEIDGERIELGSFEIKGEAIKAYYQARVKYFGEFARVV